MAFDKVTASNHLPGKEDARFPVYSKQVNELVDKLNVVLNDTQGSAIADAVVAHDVNATFSDTEVEAALDALGTKINAVIAALETAKIIAS